MSDEYDDAIAYLTEHPEGIKSAWLCGDTHQAGCLFRFVDTENPGCLTMIRGNPKKYNGGKWHDEIAADIRIPVRSEDITVENLPVFAEWQRKMAI